MSCIDVRFVKYVYLSLSIAVRAILQKYTQYLYIYIFTFEPLITFKNINILILKKHNQIFQKLIDI